MEVESVSAQEQTRLTQKRFEAAVKVIKSLPPNGPFQPSNDMMLKFYSYYKQATVGPCNIPRPGFWDVVGKAKWDAWNSLGEMPEEEAMAAYVDQMKLILEGMPMTDEVEELLRVLGPFYELIDEKKKVTQISDLSTARLTKFARQLEGFGTMLDTVGSKSIAKSVIRNMEMNGTLETRPARLRESEEVEEEDNDDDDDEEDDDNNEEEEKEDIVEIRKAQPKKKSSTRRHRVSLQNGKLSNGGSHVVNGGHPRDGDVQEVSAGEPLLNGHHADARPNLVTSDSDSEVYCDSVDQFGQEENSEHNRSLDDLEEEESQLRHAEEDVRDPPQAVRCGGEEGETGGTGSQRQRLDVEMPDGASARRGKGSRSPGPGPQVPMHSSGDGDGERWGGAVTPAVSLNEQIVVALARLQEDMQSVLERLRTLEALTANQTRSVTLPTYGSPQTNKKNRNPSWWPFNISPTSLAFAIVWPFVVQWLIRLFLQRRGRRIN
ncbi:acyl-CoA-binding domain-containing protein 5A isoform X2 [Cyprinodon tularosa]|uniref:acyl-CoA-binding domain-containing protein 5A isoform X2 n=1 Tax=Cyprinodon tularosa TaxID=77115 RepID=UPI0018E1FB57|nr:acyl-CoA-binding domain-containing protein 5A isoform X2 [Cyprinodon tularosa]